jgi:hypothetical protein
MCISLVFLNSTVDVYGYVGVCADDVEDLSCVLESAFKDRCDLARFM